MPEQFQRPENAHKRALEFLDVNKPRAAQEVLLDLIKSKRHRSWSKEHEAIMDTLVKLNVELKDSKAAKESLFQVNTVLISGPTTCRDSPLGTVMVQAGRAFHEGDSNFIFSTV